MKIAQFFILILYLAVCLSCDKKYNKVDSDMQVIDTAIINEIDRYAFSITWNNQDSAMILAKKTLQQSLDINYAEGIGNSYYLLGVAYFRKYQYDSSVNYHQKAYNIFRKSNNKKGMGKTKYSLSYSYSLMQNMQESLKSMQESRRLFEEINDDFRIYDCIEGLAYIHKQLNNEKEVDSLTNELIEVAERTGDKKKIASSYYSQGNRLVEKGYLNPAIEAFYKSLRVAEESGDSVEIANAMGGVGLANLYLREYKNAIDYYLKQKQFLIDQKNEYELSITYSNLGEAYNETKSYEKALQYHKKALDLRKKMNFPLAISNSMYNIGYSYYLMGDSSDLALNYVNTSLKICNEINYTRLLPDNYMLLGKIHLQQKKYPEAIKFLEYSLDLAKKYNNTAVLMEASGALSKMYAERKEFEKAYSNIVLYNELNDSIISGENFKRITQLEMQRAFDKKKNDYEMKHLQEKLNYETELRRNKLVRNYSLLVGLLIIAFGLFMYYSYLKSRKAEKEKEALLKEIHHRVKNNLMVVSSLLNLQSGSLTDDYTKAAVKESQSRVKSMALIHQLLYQSEMFTSIDFPKYLEQLMASLQSTYSKPGKNIKYFIYSDQIKLDIDTAIPLGLITNELATNAYKYAFIDSMDGTIEIAFQKMPGHKYMLKVSDDGKGLPLDFDLENSNTLGLKLVKILSKQIKAKLNYTIKNGTEFCVVFSETI